jgi:hypothetical protein
MIFWQIIPLLKSYKKRKKFKITTSKLCVNGREIVENKYTAAHSIPDVTLRIKKNFDPSGVLYAESTYKLSKIMINMIYYI